MGAVSAIPSKDEPHILATLENASLFIPGDARRRLALKNINLRVKAGVHQAVLGANGSGKSTLLRLLAGELWLCGGRALWRGEHGLEDSPLAGRAIVELVSPATQEQWQRRGWRLPVGQFLTAGVLEKFPGVGVGVALDSVTRVMASLDAEAWVDVDFATLSQGQLRIVLLARAIARKPQLLLLDEFCDGLDAHRRQLAMGLLAEVSRRTTMIFTAHRPEGLPPWVTEFVYMHDGSLVSGGLRPARKPRQSGRGFIEPARADGAILLDLQNVSVYIERQLTLKNITWRMRAGEHWLLTGANGSGKSTFLRLLAGDEFVAAGGHIWRVGSGGSPCQTLAETRRSVFLVSDLGQALYPYPLTALELVCSGFDNSIGIYREFTSGEIAAARAAIARIFPEGDAEQLASTSIRRLSSGQLRRLHLARALVCGARVLLLDEPCTGLDAQCRTAFLDTLDSLAASGGPGMVFVSHYEEDIPACINRAARLDNGSLNQAFR